MAAAGPAETGALVGNEEAVLAAAVREAGAAIRDKFAHGAQVFTKADHSPVTEADLAANAILVARLHAAYPADAILSEEDPPAPDIAAAPRCWIIDPLDGTASFVRREPTFAVMVALEVGGRPQVGAVYNPMSDELFTATAGRGARLAVGDETAAPLRFTPVPVATARIGTTPGSFKTLAEGTPRWTGDLARLHLSKRGFGFRPKALTDGRYDAFLGWLADGGRSGGYAWDLCATDLIIHEAGGALTDVYGHPHRYARTHGRLYGGIVGSRDPALHAAVLAMLDTAGNTGDIHTTGG